MPIIDGGGTHKKREIIAKTMPRPHASATSHVAPERPDKEAVPAKAHGICASYNTFCSTSLIQLGFGLFRPHNTALAALCARGP